MRILPILLLLFVSSLTYAQTVAKPDAKLLDAAIEKYLNEMKGKFKFAPSEFIIEAPDKSVFQNIKKKVGSTTIIIKSEKELQDYSASKVGKAINFFAIEVEKKDGKFVVDILDDGITCSAPGQFDYDSTGKARTCSLTFSSSMSFEKIDCLLLPTDPGQ